MQTLSLAMRASEDEGVALPPVFPSLENVGAKFRRSQLSLIAAAPGGMKSATASWISAMMAYGDIGEHGVPILYVSADTDKKTMGSRVTASVTRLETTQAEELLNQGDSDTWTTLEQATDHIWYYWDRGPSLKDIEEEVEAFSHVRGEWPHMIIVDNLKNIWIEDSGEGGEHVRYDRVLDYLHELAGITGAHVMVLHHVTGSWETGNQPIPLSGILGKVTKPFRLILTLYRKWNGNLGICIVKNSSARASADGTFEIEMPIDPARMQYMDPMLGEE